MTNYSAHMCEFSDLKYLDNLLETSLQNVDDGHEFEDNFSEKKGVRQI